MLNVSGLFVYLHSRFTGEALERCSSGLRGTPGKRVYPKRVSRVRIPVSPQTDCPQPAALQLAVFGYGPVENLFSKGSGAGNSQKVRRTFGCG